MLNKVSALLGTTPYRVCSARNLAVQPNDHTCRVKGIVRVRFYVSLGGVGFGVLGVGVLKGTGHACVVGSKPPNPPD